MPDIPRRKLLSSIAAAPILGALSSSVAAQTGVYGYGAPPKAPTTADGGTPARFPASCPLPPPTPQMLLERSREARERIRRLHFPDVALINQNGKKVRYYTDLLKDKVVLLNFFYAKCEGVCPGVTANLARVYKLLDAHVGHDFFMYSITLKPDHDTPPVLKEYAHKYDAGQGWMFLTGQEDDIELVRHGMGFVNSDPVLDKDKSQHIGNVCYGSEPLMLWGGHPGMTRPTWLVKEISSLIRAEAKPA